MDRMKQLGYKCYSRNGIITIYRDNYNKFRIEKAFGSDYSRDKINERLYYSRQITFKQLTHKSIFQEYLTKTNNHHKGIYGLHLYYCYFLGVFAKEYLNNIYLIP